MIDYFKKLPLIMVAGCASTLILAQPAASVGKEKAKSRLLEEVIVTAQKREENLQDVPVSVQSFSEDTLDALGVFNTSDLQMVTPTLNVSATVGFTTIYLRGVGTDAFLTADPSIGNYIDGIYLPVAAGLAQDFGVVERIEVLKGPQGTLFGRNTNGGAVNITTRDPLLNEFDAQLNVTAASYPDFYSKAYVNVPLGESFAVALSAIYSKTDHYIDNSAENPIEPMKPDENEGYRIKARWSPTEWFDATITASKILTDTPGAIVQPADKSTDLGKAFGIEDKPYRGGDKSVALDHCCKNVFDNEMLYGKFEFFTDLFDIKLLASDQLIETSTVIDFDGSGQRILGIENENFTGDIQTAELQFISNNESWGNSWLTWIFGAYKFEGEIGFFEPGDRLEVNADLALPVLNVLDTVFSITDSLGLGILPSQSNGDAALIYSSYLVTTDSESLYAQATINVTDWLDVTLGARYQDEGRALPRSQLGILISGEELALADYDYAVDQSGQRVKAEQSTISTSPKVSFEFRPFTDDSLVYLSYQEATKSGTFNGLAVTGPPTYAEPETINAWELGLKTKFFYQTLIFNAAIFDYEIENQQIQFVSLTTGGAVAFENAELANIRGIDFDFTWLIAPNIVDGLVLVGGAGWLETAELTKYSDGRGYVDNTGFSADEQNFSGNRIPKTPEISGNLALSKTWIIENSEIEVAGDVYFTDEYFYEPSNRKESIEDAYALWGARVGYFYEPWNTRITLFGKNLTDENVTRGSIPAEFGRLVIPGQPRTYGLRLAWKY